jgi:hypothetical protein
MTIATAAAGRLPHREAGDGETINLVHGSWNEHSAEVGGESA